ncbi:RHS repeat domain-containing protein [Lysobacter enzymogenes]|uniref:RHS repeat domain-containing protein n=1 Tax=Lysobacter enzymogenes TaxID=69 RepID=UPI001AF7DC5B|nr:RHS repeat-associated core domain-containing protein [Lysobacter enzymogenes]QQQ01289.1 hypothetical protein JHW41_25170 [Lysobacter enzymogenes]
MIKASYRYNAIGERVATTGGTIGVVHTYTLYDEAGHWIGDYDSTGAARQQAVWFDDAPVGVVVGSGGAQALHHVQPDHLGTPRAVIDPSRNVAVWTWDAKSEAFGNSPPNQDPDQDGTAFVFDMRFPGQRLDVVSGLFYNYHRDYDSSVGRYVQSDPIGLTGGILLYGYSWSSPLINSDPFGLQPANTVVCGTDGKLVVKVDSGQSEYCGLKECLIRHEECHAKEMSEDKNIVEFCSTPGNANKSIYIDWKQKQALELTGTQAELDCLNKKQKKKITLAEK